MSGTMAFQSNSNNAWIFNGNDGNLNYNNNRINGNYARVFRDSCSADLERYQSALIPLLDLYRWYFRTRKGKRRSLAQLRFEMHYPGLLRQMQEELCDMEYILKDVLAFILEYPQLREVIAPDFFDRVPQTFYCETIRPEIEKRLDDNSFSCRVGRGAIAAVNRLAEYYLEESRGGQEECVFIKFDQRSFFLHIFKPMLVDMLTHVIEEAFSNDPKKDLLLYLTRIMYQSDPTQHCRFMCPRYKWDNLPKHKSKFNLSPDEGVDIGNLNAQLAGNFISTIYLTALRAFGYTTFIHYTDDVVLVLRKSRVDQFFRIFFPELRRVEASAHLELNEKKTYCQDCSHGVLAVGFFIKCFGSTVVVYPSKRVVNNLERVLSYMIERGNGDKYFRLKNKEHFRDSINSYYGLFSHCNAYKYWCSVKERIMASDWKDMLYFDEGFTSCKIVKRYKMKSYLKYINKQLKKSFYYETNRYDSRRNQCQGVASA